MIKDLMFDLLHTEDWSLECRCCLHFRIFSNPHVGSMVLMLVMMSVRNKENCILNHSAPVPWPTPLTRVISLDSLSPVLSLTDVCGSWLPPQLVTSLEPPLGPGWHPRSHILMFTYPAQGINCLDLITLEDETGVPYSRLPTSNFQQNKIIIIIIIIIIIEIGYMSSTMFAVMKSAS